MIKKVLKRIVDRLRGEVNLKKLKKQGMRVGKNFVYGKNCVFDPSHCFLISIGDNVVFSTHVHILAHDASTIKYNGYAKIGRVDICDDVFVGVNTTILPGAYIGDKTIIGAGSVVLGYCEPESVYAGVPAKKICSLKEYVEKNKSIENHFDESYTMRENVTEEKKKEMQELLKDRRIGFIK